MAVHELAVSQRANHPVEVAALWLLKMLTNWKVVGPGRKISSTGPVSCVGTNLKEAADGAGAVVCTVILSSRASLMVGSATQDKVISGKAMEVAVGITVAVGVVVAVAVAVAVGVLVPVFVAVGVWIGVGVVLGVGVARGAVAVAVGGKVAAAVGAVLIKVGVNVGTTVGDEAPPCVMTGKKSVNARCDAPSACPGIDSAEWAGKNDHLVAMARRPTNTKIATRFMKNLS